MSFFGDWDGDGDEDFDDEIIELMALEDAFEIEERKRNGDTGGGCLTSLLLFLLPFAAIAMLVTV